MKVSIAIAIPILATVAYFGKKQARHSTSSRGSQDHATEKVLEPGHEEREDKAVETKPLTLDPAKEEQAFGG